VDLHRDALADVELEIIKLAIDHYNGQMSEVARRLGIGRSTLYRKINELEEGSFTLRSSQPSAPMLNVSGAERS
jgi:DNA-binding NtrC family response regulator